MATAKPQPMGLRLSRRRLTILGLLLAALLAGFLVLRLEGGAARPGASVSDVHPAEGTGPVERASWVAQLEGLWAALEAERRARQELTLEVGELRAALGRIEAAEPGVGSEALPTAEADAASSLTRVAGPGESPGVANHTPRDAKRQGEDAPSTAFDAAGLLAAGLALSEVEHLREQWERYELEKLYLADQAMREGWLLTPRHGYELGALNRSFREDLGEERYDSFLYATGQPNRVVVGQVLQGSAAEEAGLAPADTILRYDDRHVFTPGDLLIASATGEPGGTVRVEIMRDGRVLTLYVDRGPLGALLDKARRPPSGQ